jgi:hypothetical protein
MQAAQAAGQMGLQGTNQAAQYSQAAGQMGLNAAQAAAQAAVQRGQLGLNTAQMGLSTGQQLGQLGLSYGQLAQNDVNQLMQMGQISGQLGQGLGSLGMQQAALGQLNQSLQGNDIRTLEALGARDQALYQSMLDAQRMSNLQMQQFPYQQFAFLSDIYRGTPSSQSSTTMIQSPDPSTFQQIAGLGIAGLGAASGAQAMGLF